MKEIRCIHDVEEVCEQTGKVLVLFNGSTESAHLLSLVCRHHQNVTALAVDFGALDRRAVSEAACYFPVELRIIEGCDCLLENGVEPTNVLGPSKSKWAPEHKNLTRSSLLEIAFVFAEGNGYGAVFHAASPRFGTAQRMLTAAHCYGYQGAFGNPLELSPISFAQKRAELLKVGLKIETRELVSAKSSVWALEYEVAQTPAGGDTNINARTYCEFHSALMGGKQVIDLDISKGRLTALQCEAQGELGLIKQLNAMCGRLGLGRYSGEEFNRDSCRYIQLTYAPAAYVLEKTLSVLAEICLDKDQLVKRDQLADAWYRGLEAGLWFGEKQAELRAKTRVLATHINGHVRLTVRDGHIEHTQVQLLGASALSGASHQSA